MKNLIKRLSPAWRVALVTALVALGIGPVVSTALASASEVTVTRTLPAAAVNPGQQFEVTLTFTATDDNFNSIGLSDFAPEGWGITANGTWCTPEADAEHVTGNRTDYVWYGPYTTAQQFTAMYKVTVPGDAAPGTYTFGPGVPGGQVEYYIGGTQYFGTIAGDFEITVEEAPLGVVRDLPETVSKGETFSVTVTFSAPADNFNATGLSDFVPAGWTVASDTTWCTPDAFTDLVTDERVDYAWDGPYTSGTEFTAVYQVTVPADAVAGLHTFGTGDQETPFGQLEFYVGDVVATTPIIGDTQVEVLAGPAPLAVTTGTATVTGTTTATLNGNLDSLGEDTSVLVYFEYQPVAGGDVLVTPQVNKSATGAFSANILGLTAGTQYQFRAVAIGATTVYGSWVTFETPAVAVVVNAPDRVAPDGYEFDVNIDISQVTNFYGTQFDVLWDSTVLEYVSSTWGQIEQTSILGSGISSSNVITGGRRYVIALTNLESGVDGSGTLVTIRFRVLGTTGDNTVINLTNGAISDFNENPILATWIGDYIEVSVIPGDANGDGIVDIFDLTRVSRIILELAEPTPGADANGDGTIDIFDLTRISRIILGLY